MVEISEFTGGKVLESACGLGQFLRRFAERLVLNKSDNVNFSPCFLKVERKSEIANKVTEYVYSYLSSKSIKGNYGEIPLLTEDYLLSNLPPERFLQKQERRPLFNPDKKLAPSGTYPIFATQKTSLMGGTIRLN
jgi:hypothetical protein